MQYRALGPTGIRVSTLSLGAGPVSQLWVEDEPRRQRETLERAIERGINWIDTAATYGAGRSEENLGRALAELGAASQVFVGSKVRLLNNQPGSIAQRVRQSVAGSLSRLRLERLALLQIHNSITDVEGSQPTSITPQQVLADDGLLAEMERLREQGLVEHFGLTALGDPSALRQVIASGAFAGIQVPYNLLNPSAARSIASDFYETDHGQLIEDCQRRGMGVLAIRVLAGGALAAQPPSPHTLKTPFFPLALYERDLLRAEQLTQLLPPGMRREEAALRFVLSHSGVTTAVIGFATPRQVDEMADFASAGPLDAGLLARLNGCVT